MTSSPAAPAKTVAVIGGGPAGLMAAEVLAQAGCGVTVYEKMPSVGRKFLMAGRGGLNLTHSEALAAFLPRYGPAREQIAALVQDFPPEALVAWAEGLGQATFKGSSGRVFPKAMKASPLLRAWLGRLSDLGVTIRTRMTWTGWDADGALAFQGDDGVVETVRPDAVVLALGGASWPRLGSDGGWVQLLIDRAVAVAPLRPANAGFNVAWSDTFRDRFAGQPLKPVAISFDGETVRGEAMIARYGLEGGAIYALSGRLRAVLESGGPVELTLDLAPDQTVEVLAEKLTKGRLGDPVTNRLRKAGLSPVAIGVMREARGVALPPEPARLARVAKAARLTLTGLRGWSGRSQAPAG